jgi:hypothetical protein
MSTRRGLVGGNHARQGFTSDTARQLGAKGKLQQREQQRTEPHRPPGGWSGRGLDRARARRTRVKR